MQDSHILHNKILNRNTEGISPSRVIQQRMSHCLGIEASNLSPVKGKQMHQEFTPPPPYQGKTDEVASNTLVRLKQCQRNLSS